MKRPEDLPEAIRSRITVDADACWLWTGYLMPNGYGKAYFGGSVKWVHRLVYELLVGPIPEGLDLDHLCRVRHCVNPADLEPVTRHENYARGTARGAGAARTGVCINGHEVAGENVVYEGRYAKCRQCGRDRSREYQRRKRARTLGTVLAEMGDTQALPKVEVPA